MTLAGYEPETQFSGAVDPNDSVIEFLTRESQSQLNWRSDFGDPDMDIGYETERKHLLRLSSSLTDAAIARRCFLFPGSILRQMWVFSMRWNKDRSTN
jgi:hypothetical protein